MSVDGQRVVELAKSLGASFSDLRYQTTANQRLVLEDGEVQSYRESEDQTMALRVLVGGAWGFASVQSPTEAAALSAAREAVAIAKRIQNDKPARMVDAPALSSRDAWKPKRDPFQIDVDERIALLNDLEATAREQKQIHSVTSSASGTRIATNYWNSDGTDLEYAINRTNVQCHFTAKEGARLASHSARVGGTQGWEVIENEGLFARLEETRDACVKQLTARTAKGGKMQVIIDQELAGVFAHEAVGHASEADLVAAGESCFAGRLGEKVGVDGLSIRDDGNVPGSYGSIMFDDDGMRPGNKQMIKDGVLVGLLSDRERAAELGIAANGASRAQDATNKPLVRMTNTVIDGGNHSHEEVFDVKDGIYCKGSRGGQVDTARGTFLFNAAEAYRVVDGEVRETLRDVSLTGTILGTLHGIEALGRDVELGDPGHCGKGQWVPVCDGGPHLRIANILVGGGA